MWDPDEETVELDRKFLDLITVQGREFQRHSIENHIYFGPIDGEEAHFLDTQQWLFQRIFDGRLIFPPLHRLQRILDCGHGAASWAIEVAEQYPDSEVIGVDIAPHMSPDSMPENLWLQIDDLNRPFTFPANHFDLVHSRLLASGIDRSRWPSYIRDIVRVLRPGGWVQTLEMYFNVQSDNGSLTDRHALRRWSTQYMRSLEDRKDLRIGARLNDLFSQAGLLEVETKMIPLPLTDWSSNPRMRELGRHIGEYIGDLLVSLALYPLTQRLHMSAETFDALVQQAREEAKDHSLKAYFPLYVCIGRKPQ
ncbi:Methyltransferase type 25 domain-containing protein [Penicillium ucsense]|uniref:Methyltransferase type 25 domain-containing protein n=1 Tax=Penicillium ucsense TaxID=2839758 RepID=A0A8J8WI84_9EURO|nr:Methyltransferase type 25 domain-containing protein [Penicillium ucsense]